MTSPNNPEQTPDSAERQTSPEQVTEPLPAAPAPSAPAPASAAPVESAPAAGGSRRKWLISGAVAAGLALFLIGFGAGYITGDQTGNDGGNRHGSSRQMPGPGGDMRPGPGAGFGSGRGGQFDGRGSRGQLPDDQRNSDGDTPTPSTAPTEQPAPSA